MLDIRAYMQAIRVSDLPAPDRHILLTFVSLADPTTGLIPDEVMPSLTDLAGFTGLGRSTVARRLNAIEEAGWVDRWTHSPKAWRGRVNTRYVLRDPVAGTDRRPTTSIKGGRA